MQVEVVGGRPVLLFSCLPEHATPARAGSRGGTWAVPAESLLGPFDIGEAYPITDERLYVGRLLRRREDGQWLLFAFRNADDSGAFVGGVTDPMPVAWRDGRLVADAVFAGFADGARPGGIATLES